jgi:hydrogenase maturation protease
MTGVLIIAIGNPLRGDDGVAWHIAEALEQHGLPPGATLLTVHQLLPEIAEAASRAEQVIFIDASLTHYPGEVVVMDLQAGQPGSMGGTHELDAAGLLAMASRLFGVAPPATALLVGGAAFDHSETLSPLVTLALPTAVSRVLALVGATPRPEP